MLKRIYDTFILKYPLIVLTILMVFISTLGYYATKLEIDASAETLLLDDDKDLKFFREVNKRYESSNFLIVTFSPKGDLLSKESLETIKNISDDLLKVSSIEAVTSILIFPYFNLLFDLFLIWLLVLIPLKLKNLIKSL